MGKKLKKSAGFKIVFSWLLGLVFILFVGIRVINLPQTVVFSTDQGRDFLVTWRMVENKRPVFLGPPSQYSIDGRYFFFGPAPYYVLLPALLAGQWDPIFVSYYIILLNCIILLICLYLLHRQKIDMWALSIFAFFCIFTPIIVDSTKSYWNPYFMFPVSLLLLPLLLMSKNIKTDKKYFYGFIGFLFGLGLQFHYSFIFAIAVGLIWLYVNKRLSKTSLIAIVLGSILGFIPVIAFELRTGFTNLHTLLVVFTSPTAQQNKFTFNASYYLVSLFPFFFFFLSILLAKLNRVVIFILLGVFLVWSLTIILPVKKTVLDYPTLQNLSKSIESDKPSDFNIVDQLTRDNQAMALRYLLTAHGFAPYREGNYKSAHTIYIYSREPLEKLLKDPVYEIKTFLPFKSARSWKTEEGISIYRLEK